MINLFGRKPCNEPNNAQVLQNLFLTNGKSCGFSNGKTDTSNTLHHVSMHYKNKVHPVLAVT